MILHQDQAASTEQDHDPVILITAPSIESSEDSNNSKNGNGNSEMFEIGEASGAAEDVAKRQQKIRQMAFPGSGGKIMQVRRR